MKPEHAFGDGKSHDETNEHDAVTFSKVAEQVRSLKPRALTQLNLDDVLTLIEYMQKECVRWHDGLTQRGNELDRREKALDERERALALKQRAVNVMLNSSSMSSEKQIGPTKRVGFWRR